jgi:shikimate dehydrogenase
MTRPQIRIDGKTALTGIIGFPVEHSLSPVIHNTGFSTIGLNCIYVPLLIYPGQLEYAVRGLKSLGFIGVNVTAPYKTEIIKHLDAIDPVSKRLQAVNTLVIMRNAHDHKITGYNTDVYGFSEGARNNGYDLSTTSLAVVAGAGGAARAVVYALIQAGAKKIIILNRDLQKAKTLVQSLCQNDDENKRIEIQALTQDHLYHWVQQADLLVNTTPLGTWPKINESIWQVGKAFPTHITVYDLVYNPEMTLLMKQASDSGAPVIGGLTMLIHQAAQAFKLWTDEKAPLSLMASTAKRALKKLSDAADTSDKN